MDIKLLVNGVEVKVGIELAENIVNWLPDNENYQHVFHELAQHSSSSVRRGVAYKDIILNETARLLLRDKDTAVLESILMSESIKDMFNEDDFKYFLGIGCDEVVATLIKNIDGYKLLDDITVCYEAIMELNNDYLNLQIANTNGTPRKILKKLLKSDDPGISNAAREAFDI